MTRRALFRSALALPAAFLIPTAKASAMTKAQMQSLVTAITNAGFPAEIVTTDGGTTWTVQSRVANEAFNVNVNTVKSLADSQGVSAFVNRVEYR